MRGDMEEENIHFLALEEQGRGWGENLFSWAGGAVQAQWRWQSASEVTISWSARNLQVE